MTIPMSNLNDLEEKLRRLAMDFSALVGRVARLEERIELAIDAPPVEKRVVPASVVGAAAQLGEELGEGRRVARSSKESARNLRRAISPEDVTAEHIYVPPADDKPFKK